MSGNIRDTNVLKLKEIVTKLLNRLDETPSDKIQLDDEYNYILKTSPNLYNMIINNWTKRDFDRKMFLENLDLMLSKIQDIQDNKISQHSASIDIGEKLGSQFIPQL